MYTGSFLYSTKGSSKQETTAILPLLSKPAKIKSIVFNKYICQTTTGAKVHFVLNDDSVFSTYFASLQEGRLFLKDQVIEHISPEVPLEICGIDAGQATFNVAISNNRAFMALIEEATEKESYGRRS